MTKLRVVLGVSVMAIAAVVAAIAALDPETRKKVLGKVQTGASEILKYINQVIEQVQKLVEEELSPERQEELGRMIDDFVARVREMVAGAELTPEKQAEIRAKLDELKEKAKGINWKPSREGGM